MTAQQYGKHLESVMEHFIPLEHKFSTGDSLHHDGGHSVVEPSLLPQHVIKNTHALGAVGPAPHHGPVNIDSKYSKI